MTTIKKPNSADSTIPIGDNTGRRRFGSQQLFLSKNEIVIEHQGEEYRLRITSNGKLILTK